MESKISQQRISHAYIIIFTGLILRSLFSFFAQMTIASKFGTGTSLDAYFVALSLPQVLSDFLIGGVLFFGLIPVFTDIKDREGEDKAWETASFFILLAAIILLLLAAAYFLFPGIFVSIMAPGFSDSLKHTTEALMRKICPLFFLFGLSLILNSLINAYRHFIITTLSTLFFPLSIFISCFMFADSHGIDSLVTGAVIGASAQFLSLFIFLLIRKCKFKPNFQWKASGSIKVYRLVYPIVISVIALNLSLFFQRYLASEKQGGIITALTFATYLVSFPLSFATAPLMLASFPALSKMYSQGETKTFKEIATLSFQLISLLLIPISIFLMLFSSEVTEIVFQHGAFNNASKEATSKALFYLSLGAIATGLRSFISRIFFAVHDSFSPMLFALVCLGISFPLNMILFKVQGIGGLALTTSIISFINLVLCMIVLAKKQIFSIDKRAAWSLVKFGICSIMVFLPAKYTFVAVVQNMEIGYIPKVIFILLLLALCMLIYYILLSLIGTVEVKKLNAIIRERFLKSIPFWSCHG